MNKRKEGKKSPSPGIPSGTSVIAKLPISASTQGFHVKKSDGGSFAFRKNFLQANNPWPDIVDHI